MDLIQNQLLLFLVSKKKTYSFVSKEICKILTGQTIEAQELSIEVQDKNQQRDIEVIMGSMIGVLIYGQRNIII